MWLTFSSIGRSILFFFSFFFSPSIFPFSYVSSFMFSSLWEDRFDGSCVNYRMETTIWTILIALSKLSTFFENSYTCELYWPFSKINPTNFTLLCRERSIQCDTWLLESAKYRIRCNRRLCVVCCAQFTKPMKLFPSTQYLFQGWSFLPERMNYTLYERRYGKRHVPFDLSEKVWRFYGRWKKNARNSDTLQVELAGRLAPL